MEARVRTAFDDRGLIVYGLGAGAADRALPYWAGAVHYWRIDPAHWKAALRGVADLGLPLVETPVPWSVHETASGRHDWSGRKDLGRFLDLAAEAGLGAVLRVGPQVNAELTYFGLPERILRDHELLARSSHGGPVWLPAPPRAFPVPSYASARFHDEVRSWYAAVAEVVAPRLAPDGPVVAVGIDSEAQMFFRLGAYDHDYHPDAIQWWLEDGGDGDAPRAWDPERADRCVRWVRFKERYLARALGRFAAALDEVGLDGVARFHNLPPGEPWWSPLPAIAAAIDGPVGVDVRASRRALPRLRRRALHVAGSQALALAPQVELGFTPWLPPVDTDGDRDRGRDALLTTLAAGARGFGLSMAVARDRYAGAALDERGRPLADAAWIKTLVATLKSLDWTGLVRRVPIALVLSRADARFGLASSVADPVTPVVAELLALGDGGASELGRDADAIAYRRWFAAIEDALTLAEIPYVIVDEGAPIDRLRGYGAVVAPTLTRVDRGLWRALHALVDERRVVVIGPGTPTDDELGEPLGDDAHPPRRAGRIRTGSLDDLAGLAQDLAGLAGPPPDAWLVDRPDDIDCSAFADGDGRVRAVIVTSRAPGAETAELVAPDGAVLRDPFDGETFTASHGRLKVRVPARGVRLLVASQDVDNQGS